MDEFVLYLAAVGEQITGSFEMNVAHSLKYFRQNLSENDFDIKS